jgi:hypothetical protein
MLKLNKTNANEKMNFDLRMRKSKANKSNNTDRNIDNCKMLSSIRLTDKVFLYLIPVLWSFSQFLNFQDL